MGQFRRTVYTSATYCETERAHMVSGWQRVYEAAHPGYSALVRGAQHGSFMDVGFLPLMGQSLLASARTGAAIARERMWQVASDCLLAFFGKHLEGRDTPVLHGPSPAYPELAFAAPDVLYAPQPSAI